MLLLIFDIGFQAILLKNSVLLFQIEQSPGRNANY
jgi:hypothetical protein